MPENNSFDINALEKSHPQWASAYRRLQHCFDLALQGEWQACQDEHAVYQDQLSPLFTDDKWQEHQQCRALAATMLARTQELMEFLQQSQQQAQTQLQKLEHGRQGTSAYADEQKRR